MPHDKRDYDSTLARMAGNLAGHFMRVDEQRRGYTLTLTSRDRDAIARESVALARAILAELRKEPV